MKVQPDMLDALCDAKIAFDSANVPVKDRMLANPEGLWVYSKNRTHIEFITWEEYNGTT